jgi:hypothetical protein
MMMRDVFRDSQFNELPVRSSRQGRSIQHSQETIYDFLLGIVKKWPPDEVLIEFKRLFIYHVDSTSSQALQAVYDIVFANNEQEFKNTLKRCCYILVNNWDATRHYKPIQELIQVFCDPLVGRHTHSQTLKRLRQWVNNFAESTDYEELKLFAAKYEDRAHGPWTSRYTSYLLVPQYIDLRNPIEQREAARALSRQLKDRFKFDLAMYIARSQINIATSGRQPKNPTALGDDALRLIKTIVARRGPFSYANLANIFVNQTQDTTYRNFKQSLKKYLVFSVENPEFAETLQVRLADRLERLYENHDDDVISHALILRTCNRIIEYLTTENQKDPSQLFVLLLSHGNPITLVIVLLKIILICKHTRTHLESCIATLIRYYQDYPEIECTWVVNFMEVFNVTFAIHAENVQYNLIRIEVTESMRRAIFDPDAYRVFSQLKHEEVETPEEVAEIIDTEALTLKSD